MLMGGMSALDFKSICRLCVQFCEREEVSPIFNTEPNSNKISLPEKIKYCSDVEVVQNDGLPTQICNVCLSKLNQSFTFRNQCVLADITLKRLKHVSFSSSLIINFLKVDIENQIIHLGQDDFLRDIAAANLKNDLKESSKIDEFDNSKNGRHRRSISKLKSVPLQKTKAPIKQTREYLRRKGKFVAGRKRIVEKSLPLRRKRRKLINKVDEDISHQDDLKEIKTVRKSERLMQSLNKKNAAKDTKLDAQNESSTAEEILNTPNNDLEQNNDSKQNNNSEQNNDSKLTDDSELSDDLEHRDEFSEKPNSGKITKPSQEGDKESKSQKKRRPKYDSYKCQFCKKVYPSEGGWRYHLYTMHNENYKPFICDICGQSFKVKKNMEVHKNSIHFHLKMFLCDVCGRGFASKYALKVHTIWHSGEKNYACDICGAKFRTPNKRNTHKLVHGGPKKYKCNLCPRKLRWKKDYDVHMRTHTGEKPFVCSKCGRAFSSLSNKLKHEKNHERKPIYDDEDSEDSFDEIDEWT